MPKECIQLYDPQPAPCYLALGECDLDNCPVDKYLRNKHIDPFKPKSGHEEDVRHWAIHHICVQSIHNQNLGNNERERLLQGLRNLINGY